MNWNVRDAWLSVPQSMSCNHRQQSYLHIQDWKRINFTKEYLPTCLDTMYIDMGMDQRAQKISQKSPKKNSDTSQVAATTLFSFTTKIVDNSPTHSTLYALCLPILQRRVRRVQVVSTEGNASFLYSSIMVKLVWLMSYLQSQLSI